MEIVNHSVVCVFVVVLIMNFLCGIGRIVLFKQHGGYAVGIVVSPINIPYPTQSVYHAAGGRKDIGGERMKKAHSAVAAGGDFIWVFKIESRCCPLIHGYKARKLLFLICFGLCIYGEFHRCTLL